MATTGVWDITQWDESVWSTDPTPYTPSVGSYDALKDQIKGVINDTSVTDADIDQFVTRSHEKVVRDLMSDEYGRGIPMQMMARGTSITDDQSGVVIPSDFLKARTVTVHGVPARYVSPERVETGAQGLGQAPVTIDYYQRFLAPSTANPTNWLLDVAGDVYVYGACLQYVPWGKEWKQLPLWTPFYEDAIKGVKRTYGPQPRGNLVRQKSNHYNYFYTLIGNTLLFASTWRRNPVEAAS